MVSFATIGNSPNVNQWFPLGMAIATEVSITYALTIGVSLNMYFTKKYSSV